jgi:hypothetical protein
MGFKEFMDAQSPFGGGITFRKLTRVRRLYILKAKDTGIFLHALYEKSSVLLHELKKCITLHFKVLFMNNPAQDLKHIKELMERSSRFISLSGLSGVFAGIYALIGAYFAKNYIQSRGYVRGERNDFQWVDFHWNLVGIAVVVLSASLITAIFFTTRNARKKGQRIWDVHAKRLLVNLAIPLAAGGVFVLLLLANGSGYLVAPAMLLFYGLALVNGSNFTLRDIRYLGLCEIALGLLATYFWGHGLLFWTLGFGVLHIVYGGLMYWKYER